MSTGPRPGAEILIHEGGISSGQFVGVYTFDGRRMRRGGGFQYGGDSFRCPQPQPHDPDHLARIDQDRVR